MTAATDTWQNFLYISVVYVLNLVISLSIRVPSPLKGHVQCVCANVVCNRRHHFKTAYSPWKLVANFSGSPKYLAGKSLDLFN